MKKILNSKVLVLTFFFSLFILNGYEQNLDAFIKTLSELKIGNTDYYISLPIGYKINEENIPDIKTVYYFQASDSTKNQLLKGGIYIGDSPKEIPPMQDTCLVITRRVEILKQTVRWMIFKCDDMILMQSIFQDSPESKSPKLNPFITVYKNNDIEKILYIFSTIRKG